MSVVSPSWLIQSARLGTQQRCLRLSADAARSLQQISSSYSTPAVTKGDCTCRPTLCNTRDAPENSGDEELVTEASRRKLLDSICEGNNQNYESFNNGYSAYAVPTSTPASLLTRINWAITEAPHAAQTENHQKINKVPTYGVIPDSEDEDESMCVDVSMSGTQAIVADVMRDWAGGAAGAHDCDRDNLSGIREDSAHDHEIDPTLHECVIRGPHSLLLVLPTDGKTELAPTCRSMALPKGCASAYEILDFIHSFYQEELSLWSQVQLLIENPSSAAATRVLRPAFLEGRTVRRWELLGPRCGLEALVKATREPSGAVYEVRLLA